MACLYRTNSGGREVGCSRLGTSEDKVAVQKEVAVAEARCVAPDCTGSEVRAAYDRGGMAAVRALQAEKEAQLRAASNHFQEAYRQRDEAMVSLRLTTPPWNPFTPANNDFPSTPTSSLSSGGGPGGGGSLGTFGVPANNDVVIGYSVQRSTYESSRHGTVEVKTASGTYQGATANTRETAAAEDRRMRSEVRREHHLTPGEDVGHLLASLWGVPIGSSAADIAADSQNASGQTSTMNQGRTYRLMEDTVKDWLAANPDTPLRVAVEVIRWPGREDKDAYRRVRFALYDGTCPEELEQFTHVRYMNPRPRR